MSHILVTGGTGFVGQSLLRELATDGHVLRATVRRSPSSPFPAGVEVIPAMDLAQPLDWQPALDGIEQVVHLAGIAHTRAGLGAGLHDRINRLATAQLASAAAYAGVGQFVFVSSVRAQSGPSADRVLTERDVPAPTDDYGRSKLAAEQARLENILQAAGATNLDHVLEVAAEALRLPPWDADVIKLSGGERRRVGLCRLLLSKPDMLLLDEPSNHLDAESVAWLERYLQEYTGTVVAVTHDRYFLDNVAGWILELDRGHGIPWQGNYSSWLEQKENRLEREEKQETAHLKAMKQELEWVRTNPKGRRAKSKARVQRFEELSSTEFQKRNETQELYIPPGPRLGDQVVEAKGLRKGFGDTLLIDGLDFNLPPGGIVGVIGPNGAGKSTLFRMIMGQVNPDAGELRIGNTVKLAYVDQSRDTLSDNKSVWEEISNGQDILTVGNYQTPSRAYVGRFNFKGPDQQKRVRDLSGGERNRVHLAKVLKSGGNVLLLDEPTNDLDVETLRALEEALLAFPGCAVVISHDRLFLDRIATHMLAFEGDSKVMWFEGNYADYEADRKRRLGADADQPHRIKYRRLKE